MLSGTGPEIHMSAGNVVDSDRRYCESGRTPIRHARHREADLLPFNGHCHSSPCGPAFKRRLVEMAVTPNASNPSRSAIFYKACNSGNLEHNLNLTAICL